MSVIKADLFAKSNPAAESYYTLLLIRNVLSLHAYIVVNVLDFTEGFG